MSRQLDLRKEKINEVRQSFKKDVNKEITKAFQEVFNLDKDSMSKNKH